MKPTVLMVEDNEINCMTMNHLFREDFEVVIFKNGLDANIWLREGHEPALIITDLNMPDMNGYEFIAKIKSAKKLSKTPVIIVSCEESEQIKQLCIKAGACEYFTKPADFEKLLAYSKNLLGV